MGLSLQKSEYLGFLGRRVFGLLPPLGYCYNVWIVQISVQQVWTMDSADITPVGVYLACQSNMWAHGISHRHMNTWNISDIALRTSNTISQ